MLNGAGLLASFQATDSTVLNFVDPLPGGWSLEQ